MAKKPDAAPADTSQHSKNMLEHLLNEDTKTHFNKVQGLHKTIPSGSLTMDKYAHIKTGMVIRMGGPAEVGKTSQALLFCKNYMEVMPKSKTMYVNAEAKFGKEIQDRSGMKFTRNPQEWDYGTVFIFDCNCVDTIIENLNSLYHQMRENGEHLAVIVDSVDSLRLASSFDPKKAMNKRPAGVNFMTKEMFRHLAHPIWHFDGFLIMITQYSATFTMEMYEKEAPNLMDGNQTHALNHQASYAFYYRPRANSHYILEDEEAKYDEKKNPRLGVLAHIDLKKSATDETGICIKVPIKRDRPGNCIWSEKEVFDALITSKFDLAVKSGGWITISDGLVEMAKNSGIELKQKHNGIKKFSEYLEENPAITKWLLGHLAEINACENEMNEQEEKAKKEAKAAKKT